MSRFARKMGVGGAGKSDYPHEFQEQINMMDLLKKNCDEIANKTKAAIPANSASMNKYELLGQAMESAGNNFSEQGLSNTLTQASAAELGVGGQERSYAEKVEYYVVGTLKEFSMDEWKKFDTERKTLLKRKSEMTSLQNKQRTGKGPVDIDTRVGDAQNSHEYQVGVVQGYLDEIPQKQKMLKTQVRDLVKAQLAYHQACVSQLQKTLNKI